MIENVLRSQDTGFENETVITILSFPSRKKSTTTEKLNNAIYS